MKRILVYGISGGLGGIEMLLRNFIMQMDPQAVQFDFLTFYDRVWSQEEYEARGSRFFTVPSKHASPVENRRQMKAFFRERAKDYDVLWCHLAELINVDVLCLAKKYGIARRIIHSHSVGSTRSPLLTKLHYLNKKRIHRLATDFWACSKKAGAWFYAEKLLSSPRFQVMKNAVFTEKYAFDPAARKQGREEFSLEDAFVVGHVGRFSIVEKNTLFLLEVFRAVLDREPSAKLLLVGDGADRAAVEEKIALLGMEKNVIITGFREDAHKLLSAMDAFLLPSRMEGFGLVLIEAQCSGLYTFASQDVIPEEVQVTDHLHFISLQKSPAHWAEQILSAKGAERESLCGQVASAGYDVAVEADRIEKILSQE